MRGSTIYTEQGISPSSRISGECCVFYPGKLTTGYSIYLKEDPALWESRCPSRKGILTQRSRAATKTKHGTREIRRHGGKASKPRMTRIGASEREFFK